MLNRLSWLVDRFRIETWITHTLKITLLLNVRMLLIFLTLFIVVGDSFVIVSRLLHFLLHIRCEGWIFCEDLLLGHLQALEEKVGLCHADLVLIFLREVLACFQLEMFFILAFCFTDVVLKRLLFNLHLDVLFLLGGQVFVGDVGCFALFFEVACVFERCSSLEVGFEGSVHIWELALHAGVPVIFYSIVCPPFKDFGNFSPLIVDDPMH